MNEQPDKFFRDKLETYQKSPSPASWKRISSNLERRGDRFRWLKVAAAILVFVSAALWLLPPRWKNSTQTIAENSKERDVVQAPAFQEPSVKPDTNKIHADENITFSSAEPENNGVATVRVDSNRKEVAPPLAFQELHQHPSPADDAEPHNDSAVADVARETIAENTAPQKERVTIIFSAEEVNEKYLTKKSVAEATPQAKETSSFQKLLEKASDLKHNQNPIGELRQKKDEILAFNFRSDKERNIKD